MLTYRAAQLGHPHPGMGAPPAGACRVRGPTLPPRKQMAFWCWGVIWGFDGGQAEAN